jgi:hypothetical protein
MNENDKEREHGLRDKVGVDQKGVSMTCKNWAEEWWKWVLSIEEKDNPIIPVAEPKLERYRAGQPNPVQANSMTKVSQSVWFLAAPPYGVEGGIVRVKIPAGNWSILASPYNAVASPDLYPNSKSMTDLLKKDVEGVYELYATLDGIRLNGCTVKPDGGSFTVKVPTGNILGVQVPEGKNTKPLSDMVQHGHWIFLKQPGPGDHLLHLHGYSKNYELDVKYHLMVSGA